MPDACRSDFRSPGLVCWAWYKLRDEGHASQALGVR